MDELHNQPNPAPTIHPLPVKGKMDIKNKTAHNPKYFYNLLFDYKINNSNIKKLYDRTKSFIILFPLVVGVSFID